NICPQIDFFRVRSWRAAQPGGDIPTLAAAEAKGQTLVTNVGCSSAPGVLACLRAVPASTIMNISTNLGGGPGIGSTFLPFDPLHGTPATGDARAVDFGTTQAEVAGLGLTPTTQLTPSASTSTIHHRFDPLGATVANQVLSLYPAAAYATPPISLIAVESDFRFTCEARTLARATSGPNRKPVWGYLYTHAFENNAGLQAYKAFHTAE